jgi:signal transduction histidine kinase
MRTPEFLRKYQHEVRDHWAKSVRASLPSESTFTDEQLDDSLFLYLDQLIEMLDQNGDEPADYQPWPLARMHGSQRHTLGRDIAEVVREYGLLYASTVQVARQKKLRLRDKELLTLSQHLFDSASQAVAQFAEMTEIVRKDAELTHISFLAHELRNPLGSAKLAWSALCAQNLQGRAVDLMSRSLSRTLSLLDETLSTARLAHLESGVLTTRPEKLALTDLLDDVRDAAEVDAQTKGVHLVVENEASIEVLGDARLLLSAVSNLVHNAIKYTRPGGTVLVCARTEQGNAQIQVQDECGGLEPEKAERLFEAFLQANRDRRGYGLGLAIAKQAVEAHGGCIVVHNLHGQGCRFVVDLPSTIRTERTASR